MSFAGAFHEVAALVLAAAVVGALAVRLRQPLISRSSRSGCSPGRPCSMWSGREDEIHLLAGSRST